MILESAMKIKEKASEEFELKLSLGRGDPPSTLFNIVFENVIRDSDVKREENLLYKGISSDSFSSSHSKK